MKNQVFWLVLSAEAYAAADIKLLHPPPPDDVRLERPVIAVDQGVDVFAYSLETMLDMVTALFASGVELALDSPYVRDLGRRIREQYNPGLLRIPEYVYVPAPDFRQTVTLRASTTTALVDQPITLSATRETGPWIEERFVDVPIGTCWWRTAPPSFENEVAGNLGWVVSPSGSHRFRGSQKDGTRQVMFAKPGVYRLKGRSAVWCFPGSSSNEIELRIEPA